MGESRSAVAIFQTNWTAQTDGQIDGRTGGRADGHMGQSVSFRAVMTPNDGNFERGRLHLAARALGRFRPSVRQDVK